MEFCCPSASRSFFDHAWFIHHGHKPLVVPFSSKTFVKIGEEYKKGEGELSSPMSEYQVVENRLSEC